MLEAAKITRVLRDIDVKKASAYFGISEAAISELNDRCLINVPYVREILIREDWKKLTSGLQYLVERNRAYSYPEITDAVCKQWQITKRQLQEIVKGRVPNMCFCPVCGIRVDPMASKRTNGICVNCFTESLNIMCDGESCKPTE